MVKAGRVRKRPIRSCVACGRSADKRDLVRVVREPGGGVAVDSTGKRSGRGAYLCASAACLAAALKSRRLERALSLAAPLPEAVVMHLQASIGSAPSAGGPQDA